MVCIFIFDPFDYGNVAKRIKTIIQYHIKMGCVEHDRSPVNSPHKGQWRGALMFSLIDVWINNRKAGDLRRYRAHYDIVMNTPHIIHDGDFVIADHRYGPRIQNCSISQIISSIQLCFRPHVSHISRQWIPDVKLRQRSLCSKENKR